MHSSNACYKTPPLVGHITDGMSGSTSVSTGCMLSHVCGYARPRTE